jgi:hypothetical protein
MTDTADFLRFLRSDGILHSPGATLTPLVDLL